MTRRWLCGHFGMLTLPHRSLDWNPVSSLAEQMGRIHAASDAHVMVMELATVLPGAWMVGAGHGSGNLLNCQRHRSLGGGGALSTFCVEKAGGRGSFARRQVRMRAVMSTSRRWRESVPERQHAGFPVVVRVLLCADHFFACRAFDKKFLELLSACVTPIVRNGEPGVGLRVVLRPDPAEHVHHSQAGSRICEAGAVKRDGPGQAPYRGWEPGVSPIVSTSRIRST